MNRIEHRLFAYISQNWRGKPLVSHQIIVQLIGATTTQTGLTVRCEIDANRYPKGIKVTAAEMAALAIERDPFHGEWGDPAGGRCRLGGPLADFARLHALAGRESIAPEKLLGALLLQAFYSVRSERQLMEQLTYNMLFRWLVGLSLVGRPVHGRAGLGGDGLGGDGRR